MANWLQRTELLIGEGGIKTLKNAHVLVVGLGGVGAYAAEQICRAGVGTMTVVDGDVVDCCNGEDDCNVTNGDVVGCLVDFLSSWD